MQFEAPDFDEARNPNIPHDQNQLKELLHMMAYLALLLAALWLLVEALIAFAPRIVSPEQERRWLGGFGKAMLGEVRQDAKMQILADDLAKRMGLPDGSVNVYIGNSDEPNAYATFGGNIVLMQGLLDRLEHEETAAAVLAHEIGHIKHRDLLRSASRSLLFSAAGAAVFGSDGGNAYLLTSLENLRYSRELEEAADEAALHAVQSRYGSSGSLKELFGTLAKIEAEYGTGGRISWISSHPAAESRLQRTQATARRHGYADSPPKLANPWRSAPQGHTKQPENRKQPEKQAAD